MTACLSPRAERLAKLIQEWRRTRVPLLDIWRLLDEADLASRTDSRRRAILAELLEELARTEVISLPAPMSYDRTERPHLPRSGAVPRPTTDSTPRPNIVWHLELSSVVGARLTPSQVDQLAMVNTRLFRERDDLVVPVRERSLEIVGDEKALDRLLLTNLFAPDRLSRSTLRIRRAAPRMLTHVVVDGDTVLVVENGDTFDSLVRALEERPGRHPRTPPRSLSPPDCPRSGPYDALLRGGTPRPGQRIPDEPTTEQLVGWLEPAHRDAVRDLLRCGHRLAQEAVGLRYLLRYDDWRLEVR